MVKKLLEKQDCKVSIKLLHLFLCKMCLLLFRMGCLLLKLRIKNKEMCKLLDCNINYK